MEPRPRARGAGSRTLAYHLCPRCFRAVPASAHRHLCPHDGSELLTACPRCSAAIASPYVRFCTRCGEVLAPTGGRPAGS